MKISELQDKTVVNVNDGKNLGNIVDLEINNEGRVINFTCLPRRHIFRLFISNKETIFEMKDIKKIGEDVILVEIN